MENIKTIQQVSKLHSAKQSVQNYFIFVKNNISIIKAKNVIDKGYAEVFYIFNFDNTNINFLKNFFP